MVTVSGWKIGLVIQVLKRLAHLVLGKLVLCWIEIYVSEMKKYKMTTGFEAASSVQTFSSRIGFCHVPSTVCDIQLNHQPKILTKNKPCPVYSRGS